jgi:hypothetical protein
MEPDNPLRALSVQMAMSQTLGLPAIIIAYSLNPVTVPAVLAGFGGVHFVPYAWLHRSRLYIYLAIAISIGAFILQIALRSGAFSIILLYMGAVYWIAAPLVYRHATVLVRGAALSQN